MRRRVALAAVLALFALGVWIHFCYTRAAPARHAVHGAYHVHSSLSDGRGDVEAIAAAAAADGLDFVVLTDHNRLDPALLGMHQGVLIIPATEESTRFGHVVSLGARRVLTEAEKSAPLGAIREAGGLPMLAHPMNRRVPWTDWRDVNDAAGMEVLSADDLWREALAAPFSRGLITGALEVPFNRQLALLQILRRPDAALQRWDGLRSEHDLAGVCAADAHGWPDYESGLGLMSMYIDGLERIRGSDDAPAILDALEHGRAYCGVDAIAPASGFEFKQVGAALRVKAPREATIRIFRDGLEAAREDADAVDVLARPGVWRVEVELPLPGAFVSGPPVPWIISNAIRVR